MMVKRLGTKSCAWSSRTQQARSSVSGICQILSFVIAWLGLQAMQIWLLSQFVSCYKYVSTCPCAGYHSVSRIVLSVMYFAPFANISLRGNCMKRSMSPMETPLAMGSQLPWM